MGASELNALGQTDDLSNGLQRRGAAGEEGGGTQVKGRRMLVGGSDQREGRRQVWGRQPETAKRPIKKKRLSRKVG